MFVIISKKKLEEYKNRIKDLEERMVKQYEMICKYEEDVKELKEKLNELENRLRINRQSYVVDKCKLNNRIKELEKKIR